MSNVLFITTPERAEKLRPSADSPTQPNGGAVFPFPNGGIDRVVPLPGVIGGIGIAPGAVPAVPVPPPVEEKKPEEKKPEEKKP
jgi:hypothetical protein